MFFGSYEPKKNLKFINVVGYHPTITGTSVLFSNKTYWEIGRIIIEEDQRGKQRAEYGANLIKQLSIKLTEDFGQGFDESNLRNMRQFYSIFQKRDALRNELTWTHYRLLIRIERKEPRNFYSAAGNTCVG